MDKQTLSNYGWVVVLILILTVLIALATPFGVYVKDAVKSTTEGMFKVEQGALNTALKDTEVEVDNIEMNDVTTLLSCKHPNVETFDDDTKCKDCGYVEYGEKTHNGLIPKGGEYIVYNYSNRITLSAGDAFPEKCEAEDTYSYAEYDYTYRPQGFGIDLEGWSARRKETKASYNPIEAYINNEPVVKARQLYRNCTELKVAPEIPNTIIDATFMFAGCTSLTSVPNMPDSIVYGDQIFSDCTSLETVPYISKNIQTLRLAFHCCTALKKIPSLAHCTSLTDLHAAFYNCDGLIDESDLIIPSSVTTMSSVFYDCSSLKKAPIIPSSVETIGSAFRNCTNLEELTINTSTTNYNNCLTGCGKITEIRGSTPYKNEILETK